MSSTARYSLVGAAVLGVGFAAFSYVSTTAQSTPPPATAASDESNAVVARIGTEVITADDLDRALGAALSRLEQQIYDARRQRLEELVAERLVTREAERQGVSVDALIAQAAGGPRTPISDDEVERFYEQNRARLPNQPDIKDQIRAYLEDQREQAARNALIERLMAATPVEVLLPRPPVRRATVSTSGAPSRGPADAPVTLVEFTDFHCPFCRQVQPTLARLVEHYGPRLRHVFKDLPLDGLHPTARRAAEAARCANDQDRFWDYRDRLFGAGSNAADEVLMGIARDVGLDVGAFEACLADGRHRAAIQRDVEEAARLGASGTPAFFVNGRLLSGALPYEAFVQIIDEELATVR